MKHTLIVIAMLLTGMSVLGGNFLGELPGTSTIIAGYASTDTLKSRLAALPLCPAEGLWQMEPDGAIFAIERAEQSTDVAPAGLRLVMVRSPWRTVRPGTVFGHAVPTAKPGVYEAKIYSSIAQRSGLAIPRRFTLTVGSDGAMMVFKPFKSPLKINLFRLLPYLYRRVITPQQSRPDGLDGAVKLYPSTPGHPLSPVYL